MGSSSCKRNCRWGWSNRYVYRTETDRIRWQPSCRLSQYDVEGREKPEHYDLKTAANVLRRIKPKKNHGHNYICIEKGWKIRRSNGSACKRPNCVGSFRAQTHNKKKVKWSRYRSGVAQRVGRGIALLFHVRGTRRRWVVSSTPRQHFTSGEDPIPILQKAGWTPGPGLAENPVPTGIRFRAVQPVETHNIILF